jgi:hypothetical protein
MKKTLYSQFELLALAYPKWKRPNREVIVAEAGRDRKPGERADREPALPNGYVHIRSAIQALIAPGGRLGGQRRYDRQRQYRSSG